MTALQAEVADMQAALQEEVAELGALRLQVSLRPQMLPRVRHQP